MLRNNAAATDYRKIIDAYRLRLVWGTYSRVAKKLKLGKSGRAHVWRVANGERQSKRVDNALRREAERIERLVREKEAKLSKHVELERAA